MAPRHTAVAARSNLGATNTTTPWVRNPSWAALPTVGPTDQKFVGLLAIFQDSNFAALSATTNSGTYTVDWGDGSVPQAYTSGTQANYQYSYSASGLTDTPVTFTASTSTVNRAAHGYANGMLISFASIVTTTGIVVGQKYYVVNAATNTFQVSATSGGSALTLTNDGSGTILPYKMAVVVVTATTGNLTGLNINLKNTTAGLNVYETGWLDISVGSPNFSASGLVLGASTINVRKDMLEQVTLVNLGGQTSLSNMFYYCGELKSVVMKASTSSINNMSYMFEYCYSLQTVPLFNTAAVTTMSYMFYNCYSLQAVPLFNTSAVNDMSYMFEYCYSLQTVPLFNTAAVTTMSYMFGYCSSLQTVPLFNTSAVNDMSYMFYNCYSLQTVPLFNTATVTTMSYMFEYCYSLQTVPLFNTATVTNMSYMFYVCSSLQTVPLFNTAAVTNMSYMFGYCYSLQTVPLFNTAAVTNMPNMFNGCSSLQTVPAFNCTSVLTGNFAGMFTSDTNLATINAYNFKFSFSITSCKLSQTAIETVFQNLFSTTGQTITVGSGANWGAPAVISLSGTTTSGSTTVTMTSTTGLSVGMEIAGTGISTSVAVTIQGNPTNTVTLTAHGIPNGNLISFATIVTTTGITTYTPYYVVNATTNTFQISLTSGGAPITLTNTGSGTILYGTTITAITPNVSVTLSIPAQASGAITTTSALLHRSYATLRGWTVA